MKCAAQIPSPHSFNGERVRRSRGLPRRRPAVRGSRSHRRLLPPLTRHVEDVPKAWALSPLRAGTGRGGTGVAQR